MDEIFFNGVWRMDWGLGNPNKTAALIAILMVAAWGLAYVRRWGFWIALVLFTGLGVCLVHTFSRGGVVAAFMGLVPLMVVLPRPWPWRRVIAVVVSILVILGASIYLQAHKRYGQGVAEEDRSISNRFEIWKSTPAMMVDAPGGWGIGQSGKAYMNWYQPLDKNEEYRTLVNSHLTWLVEFGWLGRFLYLSAWFTVFLICFPSRHAPWLAVPLGIWMAFFIGALFSSVAESVWLWGIPSLALAWVLVWRFRNSAWFGSRSLLLPPCAALVCLLLAVASGQGSLIHKKVDVVFVGEFPPDFWVVLNKKVLGDNPGRSLRAALPDLKGMSFALAENVRSIPSNQIESVVLAGEISPDDREETLNRLRGVKSVTLVNPSFFPQEFVIPDELTLHVLVGEYSQSLAASTWTEQAPTRKLAGVGDFVPDWPRIVFQSHESVE